MLTILYNSKDGGSVPYTVALSDYQVTGNGQLNLTGRLEYNCDKVHLLHMFETLAKVFLPNGYTLSSALSAAQSNAKGLNQAPANYQFGQVAPVATPIANTPNSASFSGKLADVEKRLKDLETKQSTLESKVSGQSWTVDALRGQNIADRVRTLEGATRNLGSEVIKLQSQANAIQSEVNALTTPTHPAPKVVPAMQPVYGSTLINARGYNNVTKTLTVQFLDGNTYEYFNVPEAVYANFVNAGSPGGYYNANIKGRFQSQQLVKY